MTCHEGELTVQGDLATLRFERRLPHTVEAVWAAITDPAERSQWMGDTTIADGVIETTPPCRPTHV